MGTDDAELFSLYFTHLSVYGGKHLFIGCFHPFGAEARNICDFLCGVVQNPGSDCGRYLAEHIQEHIVQFEVGDSQTVLRPVFLANGKVSEFSAITKQIPKLANICW